VIEMIYFPIEILSPIQVNKQITVQKGLTNNFPEIVFELHQGKEYFDLGDECTFSVCITNTDLETESFTGTIRALNPHRGQILCQLAAKDFTMTGINTLTIVCDTGSETVSFQSTIFVQSISSMIIEKL
jgi:hypothetical protein